MEKDIRDLGHAATLMKENVGDAVYDFIGDCEGYFTSVKDGSTSAVTTGFDAFKSTMTNITDKCKTVLKDVPELVSKGGGAFLGLFGQTLHSMHSLWSAFDVSGQILAYSCFFFTGLCSFGIWPYLFLIVGLNPIFLLPAIPVMFFQATVTGVCYKKWKELSAVQRYLAIGLCVTGLLLTGYWFYKRAQRARGVVPPVPVIVKVEAVVAPLPVRSKWSYINPVSWFRRAKVVPVVALPVAEAIDISIVKIPKGASEQVAIVPMIPFGAVILWFLSNVYRSARAYMRKPTFKEATKHVREGQTGAVPLIAAGSFAVIAWKLAKVLCLGKFYGGAVAIIGALSCTSLLLIAAGANFVEARHQSTKQILPLGGDVNITEVTKVERVTVAKETKPVNLPVASETVDVSVDADVPNDASGIIDDDVVPTASAAIARESWKEYCSIREKEEKDARLKSEKAMKEEVALMEKRVWESVQAKIESYSVTADIARKWSALNEALPSSELTRSAPVSPPIVPVRPNKKEEARGSAKKGSNKQTLSDKASHRVGNRYKKAHRERTGARGGNYSIYDTSNYTVDVSGNQAFMTGRELKLLLAEVRKDDETEYQRMVSTVEVYDLVRRHEAAVDVFLVPHDLKRAYVKAGTRTSKDSVTKFIGGVSRAKFCEANKTRSNYVLCNSGDFEARKPTKQIPVPHFVSKVKTIEESSVGAPLANLPDLDRYVFDVCTPTKPEPTFVGKCFRVGDFMVFPSHFFIRTLDGKNINRDAFIRRYIDSTTLLKGGISYTTDYTDAKLNFEGMIVKGRACLVPWTDSKYPAVSATFDTPVIVGDRVFRFENTDGPIRFGQSLVSKQVDCWLGYQIDSVPGDCGMPIWKKFNQVFMVVGFHELGNLDKTAALNGFVSLHSVRPN